MSVRRKKDEGRMRAVAPNGANEKAIVISPVLADRASTDAQPARDPAARLAEAVALAQAIQLIIEEAVIVRLARRTPATFLGKGKVDQIGQSIVAGGISVAIMDCALSPVQQRNLERAWNIKVIDRVGLILEIFGTRAKTREGRLQVELAHLDYQRSRLVRSWTHLGRQRGGFGFMGGPGETQIEADRRQLRSRIARIKAEIEGVRATRRMHRARRKRDEYRTVALVGYTNAGKSTLFNKLVDEDVHASAMLFATLDPTLRVLALPHGTKAILSDTVGFISDLPTTLIAAFRATLEEVTESDLVLHVRDISNPDSEAQRDDVRSIISQLGLDPDDLSRVVEVWNKIDVIDAQERAALLSDASRNADRPRAFPVSAKSEQGLDELRRGIERRLTSDRRTVQVSIEPSQSEALAWLHQNAEVVESHLQGTDNVVTVKIDDGPYQLFKRRFGHAANPTEQGQVQPVRR
jgi:GTP-binding protein HflX